MCIHNYLPLSVILPVEQEQVDFCLINWFIITSSKNIWAVIDSLDILILFEFWLGKTPFYICYMYMYDVHRVGH